MNFRVDIYLSALFFYAVKKYFIIIICCQSLDDVKKDLDTTTIKKLLTGTDTTIKITITDAHDYCFIFGEANFDPFCYLVTNASAAKINGYGSVTKNSNTYTLNLKAYTRATAILSSKNIGLNS